jgi:hypothetical protein
VVTGLISPAPPASALVASSTFLVPIAKAGLLSVLFSLAYIAPRGQLCGCGDLVQQSCAAN